MKAALVAIAGVAIVSLCGVGSALSATSPRLQVADKTPLVVIGVGFGPRERVALTVSVDGERTHRTLVATLRGVFTARFAQIRLDACTGATLLATGRRSGDVVRLKIGLRECPGPAIDYP
jgi:hypothetical protein